MFASKNGFGGFFTKRSSASEAAKRKDIPKVRGWVEQMLPASERWDQLDGGLAVSGAETNVMVSQLACKEPGCPDAETVITLLRPNLGPKLMFKICSQAADLSRADVRKALRKAMADEARGAGNRDPAADGRDAKRRKVGEGGKCCEDPRCPDSVTALAAAAAAIAEGHGHGRPPQGPPAEVLE